MKLIIVSGLSGSGKTVALRTLEDAGYYCIDNLPLGMLAELVDNMTTSNTELYDQVAIAIDARSDVKNPEQFDQVIQHIKSHKIKLDVLFLSCETSKLLKRFSETRRKHPLSKPDLPLVDAIKLEKKLLENIYANASLLIDSSNLNVHELGHSIIYRMLADNSAETAILIQSFGFKHGIPTDTDFVFDVRCLPNPHWETTLKPLSGKDVAVIEFLQAYDQVEEMFNSISQFLQQWIPCFEKENRSYMTISIGCTGGQHRSVYMAERICRDLQKQRSNISIRHKEME